MEKYFTLLRFPYHRKQTTKCAEKKIKNVNWKGRENFQNSNIIINTTLQLPITIVSSVTVGHVLDHDTGKGETMPSRTTDPVK